MGVIIIIVLETIITQQGSIKLCGLYLEPRASCTKNDNNICLFTIPIFKLRIEHKFQKLEIVDSFILK